MTNARRHGASDRIHLIFGCEYRDGGHRYQGFGQLFNGSIEILRRDNSIQEADIAGLLRRELTTGHHQLSGESRTNLAYQTRDAAPVEGDSELDLGDLESSGVGGNTQVAGRRNHNTSSNHPAVQLGHGHRSHRFERVCHRTTLGRLNSQFNRFFGHLSERIDVIASAEGTPLALHRDDTDIELFVEPPGRSNQVVEHLHGYGVETVWAVENDVPDMTIGTGSNCGEFHAKTVLTTFYHLLVPTTARLAVLALVVAACTGSSTTTTTEAVEVTTTLRTSTFADEYLDEALTIMRENSLWSPVADWDEIEEAVRAEAEGALVEEETYLAIELGLRLLGDERAAFVTPSEVLTFEATPPDIEDPVVERREGNLAYVATGQFIGDLSPEADAFSADLASQISNLEPDVCGWILDLGVTRFGLPEAVLAGVAPLLDRGVVGGFAGIEDRFDELENTGDTVLIAGEIVGSNQLTQVPDGGKPIAVIIGSLTGPPGEIVAIAFRGQDDVQSFGQPSAGFGLWGEAFELSDGAVIALGTGVPTDRLGNSTQGGFPIFPDTQTTTPADSVDAAVEWLATHPSCQ